MSVSLRRPWRVVRWWAVPAVLLVLAWAIPVQADGWNQAAHYALVRALADGTPRIDRTISETTSTRTQDVSHFHGHIYAAKAPGLAFWALPAFFALEAAGGAKPSADVYRTLWFLGLWSAALPALILWLLVRWAAERLAPGYGTITATTLGMGTLVLPFASMFFAHVLTAMLGFAAFVVLWKTTHAEVNAWTRALAGVLAGFATTVELTALMIVVALGAYLLARERSVIRLFAYCAGALAGVAPLLVFNQWAFGSITHLSYAGAEGNTSGLFGVSTPSVHVASELLFGKIGLLRIAPVLVLAVVGLVLTFRRGHRAEASLIAALAVAYLVFNSGYATPFGGGSPGPRFLLPIVPFLVLAIAPVFERVPLTAIVLAAVSALQLTVITMTGPLYADSQSWVTRLWKRELAGTEFLGSESHRVMLVFVAVLILAGLLALALTTRPRISRVEACRAVLALAAWGGIAYASPTLTHDGGALLIALYAAVGFAAVTTAVLPPRLFAEPAARLGVRS
jgi:hypothetical protein